MDLPTVCIVNAAAKSGFTRINVSDFDPERHALMDVAEVVKLPADVVAAVRDPLNHDGDGRKGGAVASLTVGKGPGGRWCVKRGKERVSDLFDTEEDARAALAEIEG